LHQVDEAAFAELKVQSSSKGKEPGGKNLTKKQNEEKEKIFHGGCIKKQRLREGKKKTLLGKLISQWEEKGNWRAEEGGNSQERRVATHASYWNSTTPATQQEEKRSFVSSDEKGNSWNERGGKRKESLLEKKTSKWYYPGK